MSRKFSERRFRDDHDRLRLHARELIKLRRKTPRTTDKTAHRRASNMIEQILQVHDEADLERLRPYLKYMRLRLREVLGSNLAQHVKEDPG